MAEYGLSGTQYRGQPAQQYAAQSAPNVEWYSSSTQQQQQYNSYAYDQGYATNTSGAAYGTFDDEAPLLEGMVINQTFI